MIRLTDDSDPFFLYSLALSEDDYSGYVVRVPSLERGSRRIHVCLVSGNRTFTLLCNNTCTVTGVCTHAPTTGFVVFLVSISRTYLKSVDFFMNSCMHTFWYVFGYGHI